MCIRDRLCTGKKHVQFAGIPTFAPEHFARVTQVDTMKRKQFVKGMEQIAQGGAIQIFRDLGAGMEEVIVGVVGKRSRRRLTLPVCLRTGKDALPVAGTGSHQTRKAIIGKMCIRDRHKTRRSLSRA